MDYWLGSWSIVAPVAAAAAVGHQTDWVPSAPCRAGGKYEPVLIDNAYRVVMKLSIKVVSQADFGSYRCIAKNSLGETDGAIKLYSKICSENSHLLCRQETVSCAMQRRFFSCLENLSVGLQYNNEYSIDLFCYTMIIIKFGFLNRFLTIF